MTLQEFIDFLPKDSLPEFRIKTPESNYIQGIFSPNSTILQKYLLDKEVEYFKADNPSVYIIKLKGC